MFGWFKKKEEKKRSTVDKIVMGAIIGTAVGSVIGLTVAPKEGKETRRFLKRKFKKSNEFVDEDVKEIGKLTKETATGLFKIAKNLLNRKEAAKPTLLKKIPNEDVEEETHWAIPDQENQEK